MLQRDDAESFLPFQQSPPYRSAVEACGARAGIADLGWGTAQWVQRGRLRLVSRGPVWAGAVAAEAQRQALRRLARWPGATFATPESPICGPGLIPLVTSMHHALWALGPELRRGMAGKWRNRLAAAERDGVRVGPGGAGVLERLLAEDARQRRARRYLAFSERFTRALPAAALRLWEWRLAGEIAAAMCFVVHGGSASYHLGWSNAAARAAGVHAVMLAQAAEALVGEGIGWLDLGVVDTEAAPGLARFKLGSGAVLRRLGATCLVLP
jgi:hypothetical protein